MRNRTAEEQLQQSAIDGRGDWGCGAAFTGEQMEIFGRTMMGAETVRVLVERSCSAAQSSPDARFCLQIPISSFQV